MIFPSSLKRICDVCFYMTFASFIGLLFGGDNLMVALPFFAAAITLSVWRLSRIPLLLIPLVFFIIPASLPNLAVLAPIIAYLVVALPKSREHIGQFDYTDIFSLFIKVFFGFLVVALTLRQMPIFEDTTLPFGIMFLGASIVLMRMSRHDEEVISRPRFKWLNILSLLTILGVGGMLSHPLFLNVIWGTLVFVYGQLFVPIIGFIIFVLLQALNWIFSLIGLSRPEFPEIDFGGGEVEPGYGELPPLTDPPEIGALGVIGYIILILAVAGILVVIFKRLAKKHEIQENQSGVEETRTHLADRPKKPRHHRSQNQVRDCYRKFLHHCTKNELQLQSYMTSESIEEEALKAFHCEKSRELRALYIETRYGGRAVTKEDGKLAKQLLREIIKKGST
ncbi:MAG: DUF4129 domain-containing protein [Turicibacter sp.]|nr:DUF4129 domain-containing protein [Turicibacter sp.]